METDTQDSNGGLEFRWVQGGFLTTNIIFFLILFR